MSAQRFCVICSAPSKYAYFGIQSCRSCADFFKRTVTSGRTFVCRRGDGNCTINPKDRHNCRGCRLQKCTQFGMKLDYLKIVTPIDQQESFQSKERICSRISREYSESLKRRKTFECTLQRTHLHRRVKVDLPGENLLLCSWSFLMEVVKFNAREYMQFAIFSFPEYATLSVDEQCLMLKSFGSRLYSMETQSGTFRQFGSYDGPYSMATLTTCYDSRNIQFFTNEMNPAPSEDVVKCQHYYNDQIRIRLAPIMMKSQFTDVEYAIIFVLSIWKIDPSFPDHLIALCETVRRDIFDSLNEYYREELKLDDYSSRLGNLITFEYSIQSQEVTELLDEEVQAYNVAGMLTDDASLIQSLMHISL